LPRRSSQWEAGIVRPSEKKRWSAARGKDDGPPLEGSSAASYGGRGYFEGKRKCCRIINFEESRRVHKYYLSVGEKKKGGATHRKKTTYTRGEEGSSHPPDKTTPETGEFAASFSKEGKTNLYRKGGPCRQEALRRFTRFPPKEGKPQNLKKAIFFANRKDEVADCQIIPAQKGGREGGGKGGSALVARELPPAPCWPAKRKNCSRVTVKKKKRFGLSTAESYGHRDDPGCQKRGELCLLKQFTRYLRGRVLPVHLATLKREGGRRKL